MRNSDRVAAQEATMKILIVLALLAFFLTVIGGAL
jgi:hypothetical protein